MISQFNIKLSEMLEVCSLCIFEVSAVFTICKDIRPPRSVVGVLDRGVLRKMFGNSSFLLKQIGTLCGNDMR